MTARFRLVDLVENWNYNCGEYVENHGKSLVKQQLTALQCRLVYTCLFNNAYNNSHAEKGHRV